MCVNKLYEHRFVIGFKTHTELLLGIEIHVFLRVMTVFAIAKNKVFRYWRIKS